MPPVENGKEMHAKSSKKTVAYLSSYQEPT